MSQIPRSEKAARRGWSNWSIILIVLVVLLCPLAFCALKGSSTGPRPPAEKVIGINVGSSTSRVAFINKDKLKVMTVDRGVDLFPLSKTDPKRPLHQVGSRLENQEMFTDIINDLKFMAEEYLGKDVKEAVIAVPPSFDDSQREWIKQVFSKAGLTILRTVNEPTAALIGHGLDKKLDGEVNIVVFDMGASKLDVSVVNIDYGVYEILSTVRQDGVAGDDFNRLMTHHVLNDHGVPNDDQYRDQYLQERLQAGIEAAKRTLSLDYVGCIEVDAFEQEKDLQAKITRMEFEHWHRYYFNSTLKTVEQALQEAKLNKTGIDHLVFVGGSTRIPLLRRMVENYLGRHVTTHHTMPTTSIVHGAAVQAQLLADHASEPDCVYYMDVVPMSLGVGIDGARMVKVVPANIVIPTKKTKTFTTSFDGQTEVVADIYAGDRLLNVDNTFLARLIVTGIKPAPAGMPRIEISFQVDASDVLQIQASEIGSGNVVSKLINSGHVVTASGEKLLEVVNTVEEMQKDEWMKERLVLKISDPVGSVPRLGVRKGDKGDNGLSLEVPKGLALAGPKEGGCSCGFFFCRGRVDGKTWTIRQKFSSN